LKASGVMAPILRTETNGSKAKQTLRRQAPACAAAMMFG